MLMYLLYEVLTCCTHVLQHGVQETDQVDYVFITNGPHTATFPQYANVKVIAHGNECFDFGSWGLVLGTVSTQDYAYFFFMNSSVRGPFIPSYFPVDTSWTQLFTVKLSSSVKLVGLTVNCPDGVGRRVLHVQSMMFALDQEGLRIAQSSGVFRCVDTKQQSLYAEGDLSISILRSGYNLDVMQQKYAFMDWQNHTAGADACDGISLDVFLGPGKYDGETVHPLEMVFMKTNRDGFANIINLYSQWADRVAISRHHGLTGASIGVSPQPALPNREASVGGLASRPLSVHFVTHNLELQGAPLVLFNLAKRLMATKRFLVSVSSINHGPFITIWEESGIPVQSLSENMFEMVKHAAEVNDVLLLNTMVCLPLLESLPSHLAMRVVFAIHESELSNYEAQFHQYDIPSLMRKAARVLFVSEATRAVYSKYDFGNFYTIHNWIDTVEVDTYMSRVRGIASISSHLRNTFVITSIGTVCERKDQMTLLHATLTAILEVPSLRDRLRVMIIGQDGSQPEYEVKISNFIQQNNLNQNVFLVPPTTDVWQYLAIANLHVSTAHIESLPLNVMEAMAARVPVVATGVFGTVELIMDGKNGVLMSVSDSRFLASSIVDAATALPGSDAAKRWENMASAAAFTVKEHFSPSLAIRRYSDLFKSVSSTWKHGPPGVNKVCIVVRTFNQHASGIYNLTGMLRSLVSQERENWYVSSLLFCEVVNVPFVCVWGLGLRGLRLKLLINGMV